MSERFIDLDTYGISYGDQQGWHEVRDSHRDMPPYPEALRDKTKPVLVLNMAAGYVKDHHKRILRTLVGKIDGMFTTGVAAEASWAAQEQFNDSFHQDAVFDGRTLIFGRTKILHLPSDQYELTEKPTEWAWGRKRVQDTPVEEVVELFDTDSVEDDAEIIIIPPFQANIDEYAQATEEKHGKTPHVAFFTETRFADNVSWRVTEYRSGMPNLMGMESGAL